MPAPIVRNKRTSVSGKTPTTTDLSFGEFGININDGKVFISASNAVVGVGTTVITVNPWSVGVGSTAYNTYFNVGNVGIGTTNPISKLQVQGNVLVSGIVTATTFVGALTGTATTATNLNGGLAGNIVYQSAPNTTAFLANGSSGTVLQSNGVGNAPTWVAVTPAGAITGLVVRDSTNTIVGTSGSVTQLTFGTGLSVTGATGAAGIATITLSSNIVGTSLSISGISTFANGPVLIGSGTSTGTASQPLQVTGGAYVSGNLGVGITNSSVPLNLQSSNTDTFRIQSSTATTLNFRNDVFGGILDISNSSSVLQCRLDARASSSSYILGNFLVGSATSTGTASQPLQVTGGAYVSGNLGIGSINPTSKLSVVGDVLVSGVTTASRFVSNIATGTAPLTVSSTTLVANLNADLLDGNDSTYYTNASNLSSGTIPSARITASSGDFNVGQNLNVTGNITIGGTTAILNAATLQIKDKDIVLGITTNASNQDVSTDTTANHGGVAIASTEGTPLIDINAGVGTDSIPSTYKQIMWLKSGSWTGLGTDAWLFNYGVGIGSTQVPNGVRLAVGGVQFTQNDLAVVRNINASGIVTATTFSGNLANILTLNTSGTGLSGSTTYNNSGVATFTVTSNATSANTASAIVARDASGNFSAGTITAALTGNVTGNVSAGSGSCTGNAATVTNGFYTTSSFNLGTTSIAVNRASATQSLTGINIDGSSGSCTGNATTATTASNLTGLTLNSSAAPINPDNVTQNQIGYDNSVSLFAQTDGGLYSSAYSSSWIHQIHGDFRTGQIAIRGKNNGTWQAWRTVLDSSNYNSYSPTLAGTGAFGTWSINVTGNAATVTNGFYTTSSFNLGTTSIAVNRASATQSLTGINIDGSSGSCTGNAATVTTNANLTGDVTSIGNATAIAAGVIVDADINASAGIVDTKLATISTTGKVSNSATTATSANTASTIVARDASGNFSAGTITANLTGTASLNVLKAGDTITGQLISTLANNTATGGGQIYLNGATGNRIDFNANGTAAPSFTTRSTGTKLVLYPNIGASTVDWALGIDTNTLWSSVADSASQFKWYAGTTNIATLFGTGELVLGTTAKTGTASQPLQVTGGGYVSGSVGIGSTIPRANLDVVGNVRVSGISTLGTVQISSGIVTAITGIVTYYGDGSNLSGTNLADLVIPLSDETTALTASSTVAKVTIPYWPRATVLTSLPIWMVNTAPTGAALQFDIQVGGTSIYLPASGGTYPTIAISGTNSTSSTGTFTTSFAAAPTIAVGSSVTFFIRQIGSTVAGAGLKVVLFTRRAS